MEKMHPKILTRRPNFLTHGIKIHNKGRHVHSSCILFYDPPYLVSRYCTALTMASALGESITLPSTTTAGRLFTP